MNGLTDEQRTYIIETLNPVEEVPEGDLQDCLSCRGKIIATINREEHRHYDIVDSIYKVGDRYFGMKDFESHNEMVSRSDISKLDNTIIEYSPKEISTTTYEPITLL